MAGGGGSGEGESDGAELATLMPVGTEGALGGAEDGTLTASGALTSTDADIGDTATWAVVGGSAGSSMPDSAASSSASRWCST